MKRSSEGNEVELPLTKPTLVHMVVAVSTAVACSSPSPHFETAKHLAYPQIPTGGGPVYSSADIVTVSFVGDRRTPDLTSFVDWLGQSDWLSRTVGEYGVRGVVQRAHVDLPSSAPSSLTDVDVEALLAARLADGTIPSVPATSAPFVYVLFFPDGTTVTRQNGRTCQGNPGDGYHDTLNPSGAAYIVTPSCNGTAGMESQTARLLVNTLTDPSPRNEPAYALTDDTNPWTAIGVEVGDLCYGRFTQEGAYELERVWSNKAAAGNGDPCVPALPGAIAFGMTATPSFLQEVHVGVPFEFTVTGWSLAPVPDWTLQALPWGGDFAITAALDRTTMNNGTTAVLKVTIPFAVPSGTYGAVRLEALQASDFPSWPVAFVVR